MEYQKAINVLNNTPNQPSKFRKRNWVEKNDDFHGTYRIGHQLDLILQ